MPLAQFDGGLEALDRKVASFTDLVAYAAQVLNVDLNQQAEDSGESATQASASTYSFKEQWVLRWLTRSIAQALQSSKDGKSRLSTTDVLLDPAPWQLMQHLLSVIPSDTAIDILVERKFLSSLDRSVRLFLDRDQPTTPTTTSDSTDTGTVERSRKRRRLSPEPSEQDKDTELLLRSLLRLCATCASLVSPVQTFHDQNQARLSTSVEESASLLSSSLGLGLRALESSSLGKPIVAEKIRSLLCFWSGKPVATSESARQTELKLFNKQSLPVCLKLLVSAKDKHPTAATSLPVLATDLERLIASSVIVPLRARFLKKHAAIWKKQRPCLTWTVLGPVYRDFMASFGADPADLGTESVTMIDFVWKSQAHQLYNLAARLLPKFDLRRKQQEQDWLDCLLVVLSYTCCPQLSQISVSATNQVEVLDAAYASHITNDLDGFESLVEWTATSRCSPSLQATSYLAAAVASWNGMDMPWTVLGNMLKIHSNLLLSNAGVPTSDFALKEIVSRLEQSSGSAHQYEVAKRKIVVPVLQAFSRARALKEFLGLWHGQLQEALRVTSSNSEGATDKPLVTIWQDEDLLDSFSEEISTSTNTTVTGEVLAQLKISLSELPSRIGSTLDIFAHVALVTALLQAKGRNSSSSEPEMLQEAVESVVLALGKRSDYQGQRWRLWLLLDVIQYAMPGLELPEKLLRADTTTTADVSLAALLDKNAPNRPAYWYQECLEQFKVITREAAKGSENFWSAHQEAVGQLESYIERLSHLESYGPSEQWNGRSLGIITHEQLASASVGVLLCNPAALKARPAFFKAALRAIMQSSIFEDEYEDLQTVSTSINSVLAGALLDVEPKAARVIRKTSSEHLTTKLLTRLLSHRFRHIVESYVLQDRGSNISRGFASVLFELFQEDKVAREHSGEVVLFLTTMDYMSDQHQTTFTKPEAWETWLKIGDRICQSEQWTRSRGVFTTYYCLRSILDKISAVASENDLFRWVGRALAGLESIKPSKSKARLLKQPSLLCQTEALLMKSDLNSSKGRVSLRRLAETLQGVAASDLWALSRSVGDFAGLAKTAVILESVSRTQTQYPPKHDFREAVIQIQSALHKLPDDEDLVLADLRATVQLQCTSFEFSSNPATSQHITEQTLESLSLSSRTAKDEGHGQLARTALEAYNFVQSLSLEDRISCIRLLSNSAVSTRVDDLRPFLLAAIAVQSSNKDLDDSPDLKAGLADIACLKGVGHAQALHQLLLELENANLVLTTHPTVVGQATVDTLLAQLTLVLSGHPIDASRQSGTPELIHKRVCIIIGSLLSRFRRRMADRYHLLLPVLQQLTRCLFFSDNVVKRARQPIVIGSDPSSFLRSIPEWLISSAQPLSPASAVEVSRILSSICNPTVSAAKSSRSRGKSNELNDETKRVKAVAGQHLQYLVMDYCRCTLDGDIAPAVKEKLLPGLYKVLDAMSRDLMRAMNSAMDPSSRAIFKTLYDDWTRYGKWDKS